MPSFVDTWRTLRAAADADNATMAIAQSRAVENSHEIPCDRPKRLSSQRINVNFTFFKFREKTMQPILQIKHVLLTLLSLIILPH